MAERGVRAHLTIRGEPEFITLFRLFDDFAREASVVSCSQSEM